MNKQKTARAGKSYHVVATIPFLLKMLYFDEQKGRPQGVLHRKDGKPMSYAEARQVLEELRADGFECLPSCENHDKTGRCLGHKL